MSENQGPDLSNTELKTNSVTPYRMRTPQGDLAKYPVLIMMHGYGANEGDIFELVQFVDKRVLVAAPRAPLTVSNDPRGSFCWFTSTRVGTPTAQEFADAVALVKSFIEGLEEASGFPLDYNQVYVGGFSQGGGMTYLLTCAHPEMIAGAIVHSGFLNDPAPIPLNWEGISGKPFYIVHGTNEDVLPIERGRAAMEQVKAKGADVTYEEYPIKHESTPETRQALAAWLDNRLQF